MLAVIAMDFNILPIHALSVIPPPPTCATCAVTCTWHVFQPAVCCEPTPTKCSSVSVPCTGTLSPAPLDTVCYTDGVTVPQCNVACCLPSCMGFSCGANNTLVPEPAKTFCAASGCSVCNRPSNLFPALHLSPKHFCCRKKLCILC